ncbi:MAG: site-2 protease family protein [Blastocatellia bacterium]
MRTSLPIGALAGTPIHVHFTWLIIAALELLSLLNLLGLLFPALPLPILWILSLAGVLLFFVSVLAHELAHSMVARRMGQRVRAVTLYVFGGVTEIESESKHPRDEISIAMAGPLASLALAFLFASLHMLLRDLLPATGLVTGLLALANAGLTVFNMLPGLPLDGGVVLRGILWLFWRDQERATRVAVTAGRAHGYVFILWGIGLAFAHANLFGGMWAVFMGWFVLHAAETSGRQIRFQHAMAGLRASQVMTTECPRIPVELSLADFVDSYLMQSGDHCFVVTEACEPRGIITLTDVRAIPRQEWPRLSLRQAMRPLDQLRTVTPETEIEAALSLMSEHGIEQAPVMQNGRLVGLLSRDRLLHLLRNRSELAA